jgi:hypothetical protein
MTSPQNDEITRKMFRQFCNAIILFYFIFFLKKKTSSKYISDFGRRTSTSSFRDNYPSLIRTQDLSS